MTVLGRTNVSTTENTNVFYEDYWIGNQNFLSTFNFPVLQGNPNTALIAPHSVILTEETAKKLFSTTAVIGKEIKVEADSTPFKITAVLKNFPVNSHLSFNLLFSESSLTGADFEKFASSDWSSGAFTSYLLLDDKADPHQLEAKIKKLVATNQTKDKGKSKFILQPLKDIHFYSNDIEGNSGMNGNIAYIYVFSIVALFVLIIACINYMNLTTARFSSRAKEIAVRKVAGASRKNLLEQFLTDAFLISAIALVLALGMVKILLPSFNAFTQKQLTLGWETDFRIWIGVVVVVCIVVLLSGLYPALFQSRFKPLSLLKSKISVGKANLSLRRSLVVFQFALSIILIIATIVVYIQMKYITTKDLGFDKEQLLVIDINSGKVRENAETIKTELAKLSSVKDVAVSSRVPGEWKDLPKIKVKSEKILSSEGTDMYFLGIDDSFLRTYGITVINGRNFIMERLADSSAIIINQTAAKELGITEPAEQIIKIPLEQPFKARIIGIVKDFNFQSLRQPLAPMVLGFQNNPVQKIDYFTIKVASSNMSEILKQANDILHDIDQNHLFEYHFLDKQWELLYRQDRIREIIILITATLTIVIACLGLFGLATYAAEQRIKEIGIRKVLGASVSSIVTMLSSDFLKLVLIAAAIAYPLAWWLMNQWLHDFAYRITISLWVFIASGLIALLIAFITTSFQPIKAALSNPVKSLRAE
jgi:putative ABC transport system permease protein